MMSDFDKAFAEFTDRHEYDEAESALHSMIRTSFKAGWLAAMEKTSKAQKVIELPRLQREMLPDNNLDNNK